MRPDGTRVKNLPPLVAAIPYIMPKRYDAWNTITENIDEEVIKEFIRDQRRQGVRHIPDRHPRRCGAAIMPLYGRPHSAGRDGKY